MKVLEFIQKLNREESGQDLIEYALVVAVVAGAAVGISGTLAADITNAVTLLNGKITAAFTAA